MIYKYYTIYICKYTGVMGIIEKQKGKLPEKLLLLTSIDPDGITYEEILSEHAVELGWSPGYSMQQAWSRVPRSFHELSAEARRYSLLLSRGQVPSSATGRSLVEDRISME